jgi:hypothetical protein
VINFKKCLIVFGWCIHVNSIIFCNTTISSNISRKYHEVQMDQLQEICNSIGMVYSCEQRNITISSNISRKYHDVQMDQLER